MHCGLRRHLRITLFGPWSPPPLHLRTQYQRERLVTARLSAKSSAGLRSQPIFSVTPMCWKLLSPSRLTKQRSLPYCIAFLPKHVSLLFRIPMVRYRTSVLKAVFLLHTIAATRTTVVIQNRILPFRDCISISPWLPGRTCPRHIGSPLSTGSSYPALPNISFRQLHSKA
jgi:hypothetical protein